MTDYQLKQCATTKSTKWLLNRFYGYLIKNNNSVGNDYFIFFTYILINAIGIYFFDYKKFLQNIKI